MDAFNISVMDDGYRAASVFDKDYTSFMRIVVLDDGTESFEFMFDSYSIEIPDETYIKIIDDEDRVYTFKAKNVHGVGRSLAIVGNPLFSKVLKTTKYITMVYVEPNYKKQTKTYPTWDYANIIPFIHGQKEINEYE